MNTDARLTAKLLSACPPDSAQKEKLEDVLSKKYGKAVEPVSYTHLTLPTIA